MTTSDQQTRRPMIYDRWTTTGDQRNRRPTSNDRLPFNYNRLTPKRHHICQTRTNPRPCCVSWTWRRSDRRTRSRRKVLMMVTGVTVTKMTVRLTNNIFHATRLTMAVGLNYYIFWFNVYITRRDNHGGRHRDLRKEVPSLAVCESPDLKKI